MGCFRENLRLKHRSSSTSTFFSQIHQYLLTKHISQFNLNYFGLILKISDHAIYRPLWKQSFCFFKHGWILSRKLEKTKRLALKRDQWTNNDQNLYDFEINCPISKGVWMHLEHIPCIPSVLYDPCHEKTCLCYMQTTKAQISLCIRALWSAPLLFAAWTV